jgi:arsenate reductase
VANVLFVCIGNQGRSLMAERLFRRAASGRHEGRSAGSAPGSAPHPEVVAALREVGIDGSDHVPTRLDGDLLGWADVVVAACDGACPLTPGKRRLDWHLPDPAGRPLQEVRAIRDDIEQRVGSLAAELDRDAATAPRPGT